MGPLKIAPYPLKLYGGLKTTKERYISADFFLVSLSMTDLSCWPCGRHVQGPACPRSADGGTRAPPRHTARPRWPPATESGGVLTNKNGELARSWPMRIELVRPWPIRTRVGSILTKENRVSKILNNENRVSMILTNENRVIRSWSMRMSYKILKNENRVSKILTNENRVSKILTWPMESSQLRSWPMRMS